MNSFGATLTLFFALIVLFAPRSWAALGVIGGVCYVTQGQQIYTLGFHFTAIRIILLAGFIRCLVRGELNGLKFDAIGKAVIGYALAEFFINIARERSHQTLVYMLGGTFDISLSYFVMRSLIASVEDARTFLRKLPLFIIDRKSVV